MIKTILTLTAVAALGAAILAPSDAAAAPRRGAVNHPRPVVRNVVRNNIRNNINIRVGLGVRRGWRGGYAHRPFFRGPVRYGYRPFWHRPGFRHYGYRPGIAVPLAAAVVAAPAYAGAPGPGPVPAMGSQVNGMNVVMVAVPNGQFTMTGQGQWTRTVNNGNSFQFAEVGRDASSVTLNDASRNRQVILDLGQRKVLLAAPNGTTSPLFPIVNASAR